MDCKYHVIAHVIAHIGQVECFEFLEKIRPFVKKLCDVFALTIGQNLIFFMA